MNDQSRRRLRGLPFATGILSSFLIFTVLVWALHRYTQPPPLGENRVALRAKALADMRGAEAAGLDTAAWIDRGKGVVRLPIGDAMKLVVREWGQDPAAARSNLIARVEKATAPPPKAPEAPSPFK
ncbi:MAG: hypothetical protein ACREIC_13445 [Limisphaerales bacterium]